MNTENQSEYPNKPVVGTTGNFEQEVLDWPETVLLEFFATWCGHCRMMAPVLEELAKEKAGSIKVVTVDIDKEPKLVKTAGIKATPTLMLFKNGKKYNTFTGAMPKEELESWIENSLSS